MDQAEKLRNIIKQQNQVSSSNARIITVTSGKGGVGLVPRGVGEGVGAAAVADGVEEGRFPGVAVGIPAVGGFGADASGGVADVFVAVVAADVDGTLVRAALGGGWGRRCAVGSLGGGA